MCVRICTSIYFVAARKPFGLESTEVFVWSSRLSFICFHHSSNGGHWCDCFFFFSVFLRFCFCFEKAARFVSTLMCRFVRHACAHYWYVIRTCALVKHCRCLCVLSSLVDVLFFNKMPSTDSRWARSLSDLPADVHIFNALVLCLVFQFFILLAFQRWMGSSSA